MIKLIPLTQGKFAIVDDENFDFLNQWKWHYGGRGYAVRGIWNKGKSKLIYLHRFITNCPLDKQVDHINRNRLDNRKKNLRIVTHQQNMYNRNPDKRSKSGLLGVHWVTAKRKWMADISNNKKTIFLGYFINKQEAYKAYLQAKSIYHVI